ncbi:hypothetical protein KOM00_05985 [Geomonas sp. Red69]|nr:hypothetical protein [Geomonas diazotrophica]
MSDAFLILESRSVIFLFNSFFVLTSIFAS